MGLISGEPDVCFLFIVDGPINGVKGLSAAVYFM